MIVCVLSLSKLETVLAQTIGGRLNGEPRTPLLNSILKAARLSFKHLMSEGQNIVICFFFQKEDILTFHQ